MSAPAQQLLVEQITKASSAGPSSFGGHEWLIVLNLGLSTALALGALFFLLDLVKRMWGARGKDRFNHPVTLFRTILALISFGIMLRKGSSAWVLWRWNPESPIATGAAVALQRFVDPVADLVHACALGLVIVVAPVLVDQLRREPLKIPLKAELPRLKMQVTLTITSLLAAAGVVLTR